MKHLVLYSKDGCPFCALLKMELTRRGSPFTVVDLSDDTDRNKFYENTGTKTVPQLFAINGDFMKLSPSGVRLGGYSDVSADWSVLILDND